MAKNKARKVDDEFREYAPTHLVDESFFYYEDEDDLAKRRITRYLIWSLITLLALIAVFYILILYLPA